MIGQGVYTLSEVSRFTGVPKATVRSWFKWGSVQTGKGPIFESDFDPVGDDYAVSFLNLIEVHVAAFFRSEGVRPHIIRRANEILKAELHTRHPFAHEDLRTDGARIIQRKTRGRPSVRWVDTISKQMLIPQFKNRLKSIRYNRATSLAESWSIDSGVVISPGVGFGKPVIEKTGISTNMIANQYIANSRNASLVARLFKITEVGVMNAYHFENGLGHFAA